MLTATTEDDRNIILKAFEAAQSHRSEPGYDDGRHWIWVSCTADARCGVCQARQ